MCDGFNPEPDALPSPKSQTYEVIADELLEGVASKNTVFVPRTIEGFVGENVKSATICPEALATVTVRDVVPVWPASSVTTSETVNVPARANAWVGEIPDAAAPSPKSQL